MNNKGRSIGELQMMEGQSDLPNCIKIQLYSLKSDFPIKITLKLSLLKVVPATKNSILIIRPSEKIVLLILKDD